MITILGGRIKDSVFQELTTTALSIWKLWGHKVNSCRELLRQFRSYMLNQAPYNAEFFTTSESPINWWQTIFDGGNQLQRFAIKLFSVSPHSASCERQFSRSEEHTSELQSR